jgi:hypothetical protein
LNKYITITRGALYLGTKKIPRWENSKQTYTIKTQEGKARIISPQLALYQYEKGTDYSPARYHVIHISTGLVIADITYDLVKDVKETFEKNEWSLRGENTFVLQYSQNLQWEFTCYIRYDVNQISTES